MNWRRFLSRKFIAFVVATILLVCGVISEKIWLIVVLSYVGSEGLADLITRFKRSDDYE